MICPFCFKERKDINLGLCHSCAELRDWEASFKWKGKLVTITATQVNRPDAYKLGNLFMDMAETLGVKLL